MQTQLFEYVRQRKQHRVSKIGILLAKKEGERVLVAWSKCRTKMDSFDPEIGKALAEVRLIHGCDKQVPRSFQHAIDKFSDRVRRYFRVDTASVVIVGKPAESNRNAVLSM